MGGINSWALLCFGDGYKSRSNDQKTPSQELVTSSYNIHTLTYNNIYMRAYSWTLISADRHKTTMQQKYNAHYQSIKRVSARSCKYLSTCKLLSLTLYGNKRDSREWFWLVSGALSQFIQSCNWSVPCSLR